MDYPNMAKQAKKKKGYEEYEIREMVDCLIRAEEIKNDKQAMKALEPFLKKKSKAIRSIDELRKEVGLE